MTWLEIVDILMLTWFGILIVAGIVFYFCNKKKTSAHILTPYDIVAFFLLVCVKPYMLCGLILSILHFVLKYY